MSFASKLVSKGWLGSVVSKITKGWIRPGTESGPTSICDFPHAVKLATKGHLGSAIGTATSGVALRICNLSAGPKTYCDMPHAVNMATMGRIGSSVASATVGRSLKICILTDPIDLPIDPPKTGPANRGFRKEEVKKQKINVCVEAYGKKFCHEEIVSFDHKITVKDLEITELGNNQISISVKRTK